MRLIKNWKKTAGKNAQKKRKLGKAEKYLCSISAGAAHGNCFSSSFDAQTNKKQGKRKA